MLNGCADRSDGGVPSMSFAFDFGDLFVNDERNDGVGTVDLYVEGLSSALIVVLELDKSMGTALKDGSSVSIGLS